MADSEDNAKRGIVYILTNESMPGHIKIGKTGGDSAKDVQDRMRELDKTGVPRPFECVYAAVVRDHHTVEKGLHTTFEKDRIRPTREFFEGVPVHSAIAALKLVGGREVTPGVTPEIDEQGKEVPLKPPKRPHFSFKELEIPVGAVLTFVRDEKQTCTVEDGGRSVKYQGERTTVSGLAQKLLNYPRSVGGPNYWVYEGETLHERRMRMGSEGAEEE